MEVLANNELRIFRNESFTIDKIIRYSNGFPFVISNKLSNPYILLSITNSRYNQEGKYIYNKWLDLSDYPKFNSTTAVNIASFKENIDDTEPKYTSFDDITTTENGYVVYGYVGDYTSPIGLKADECIFFISNNGENEYKYAIVDEENNEITWKEYKFEICTSFSQELTNTWNEQSYYYSITLVDGEKNSDDNKPLASFNVYQPILKPTKLSVISDTQGGTI